MGKGLIKSEIGAGLYSVELDVEGSDNITQNIWCADYTEDITGTVGIIEIAGEKEKGVNIQPGYLENCVYSEDRDGKLAACGTTKDEAWETFWNWSMRPGWQKWRPNYRYGTITSIDRSAKTCNITLDECISTDSPDEEDLNVNQSSTLTDVSFFYMSCDSAAFEVGDSVIIEFQGYSWALPVVIGFESNPRSCASGALFKINYAAGYSAFAALASARAAEINKQIEFANHCKNVFIPQVLNHLQSLLGLCSYVMSGACLHRWTQAEIDQRKQPYIDWYNSDMGSNHDLGYDSYIAELNDAKDTWTAFSSLISTLVTLTKCSNTGTIDDGTGDHDVSGVALNNFDIWIDCCGLDAPIPETVEIEAVVNPGILDTDYIEGSYWENTTTGQIFRHEGEGVWTLTTPFQKSQEISKRGETYWDLISDTCSPPTTAIVNYASGSVYWYWQAKGGISTDRSGETTERYLYYLTKNPGYYVSGVPGGQVETLKMNFTIDGDRPFFECPTPVTVLITKWLLGAIDEQMNTSLSLRASGRLQTLPEVFGATVDPVSYDPDGIVTNIGGINIDYSENSWAANWYVTPEDIDRWEIIPYGFERFAGLYPDHPIVTGTDVTDYGVKTMTLKEANDYVNANYTYKSDEEDFDQWQFLGPGDTEGDCEDFALTKVQLLLDNGWSISDLKLCGGSKEISYSPPIFDDEGNEIKQRIGHLWVLAEGQYCLDSDIVTLGVMDAMYPLKKIVQVSGLTWKNRVSDDTEDAEPWPHYDFDEPVCEMSGYVVRKS